MSKRKRPEIEPSPEHIESAVREAIDAPPPHDAHGLFYEDPRFAALASIARAAAPCPADVLALVGATDGAERLPTDAEALAAAHALAALRDEHLSLLAARRIVRERARPPSVDEKRAERGSGGGGDLGQGDDR